MADMKRKGYGQVEPNHLSAQYTGQIYAQLPAQTYTAAEGNTPASTANIAVLENGQFLKYNYAGGRASVDGDGEWMLVFNEVKLYDERRQNYKDFAMKASEMADKMIYPRLLKTNVGDIFTTNTFRTSGSATVAGPDAEITMPELAVGNYVTIDADGWLKKANSKPGSGICFQVVKVYHLADQQDAVKLQRIQ